MFLKIILLLLTLGVPVYGFSCAGLFLAAFKRDHMHSHTKQRLEQQEIRLGRVLQEQRSTEALNFPDGVSTGSAFLMGAKGNALYNKVRRNQQESSGENRHSGEELIMSAPTGFLKVLLENPKVVICWTETSEEDGKKFSVYFRCRIMQKKNTHKSKCLKNIVWKIRIINRLSVFLYHLLRRVLLYSDLAGKPDV